MKESIAVFVVALMFLALSGVAQATTHHYGSIPATGNVPFDSGQGGKLDAIAPATISLIPEPATIILLGCGGMVLIPRRRN